MKQNSKWVAALFTAASTTLAFGWCGSCDYGPSFSTSCSSCSLAPVGERVVVYRQSGCLSGACGYSSYSEPSAGQVVGSVITAPFRLIGSGLSWTGRTLSGQPAVVGSDLEPIGERYTYYNTYNTSIRRIREPAIAPVGERFTTVRVIRYQRMLQPVGERFTTVRVIRHQRLEPIGERFVGTRVIRYQPMPVGERFTTVRVIRHHKMLQPIGEKVTSCKLVKHHKIHKKVMLRPVGERTLIRTTTFHTSSCGCGL